MRFIVREGSEPLARADATILKAMGLPSGGVIRVGTTHVLVRAGQVREPSAILLGPQAVENAGVTIGSTIDVVRAVLPSAHLVVVDDDRLPARPKMLLRALQGRPLTPGDRITIDGSYLEDTEEQPDVDTRASIALRVLRTEPQSGGLVGAGTRFVSRRDPAAQEVWRDGRASPSDAEANQLDRRGGPSSTTDALLAGLDDELDLASGWFSLLTSPQDLPAAWGLPRVAGILLEGPHGCGKSELVAAAASAAGTRVHEVTLDLVFKPERLLDLLEKAVKEQSTPCVIFVDRLEVVAGEQGMSGFRTQIGAILRWFLDAVAEKPGLAAVLGVASRSNLDDAITSSPLLPRALSIPPPDRTRRRMLFEAAMQRVPNENVDYDVLADRSAGFSGADVVASVIHASSRVALDRRPVGTADLLAAVEETQPSLGSLSLGEMPSYGFERVANLADVKQRLTEAVIWPVSDPDRFRHMGIDPPRGILLFGPPGTGKTFVVRALANKAGAAFFSVKGAELLDKYVGESERGVREVFARARAAAPSIIFFDEFDALAPVRGRSTTSVTDSVVAALLTEIDGVGTRGDVSVIAATNRRDLIDPALLRAGRFEIQIEIGLPGPEGRRALLEISNVPFAEDVDLDSVVDMTEGMSFADLDGVLREAALDALRADNSASTVSTRHIESAIARWKKTRSADST